MRKFHCLGSLSFPRWLTSTSSPNFDRSRALGLVFVGEMLCRTKERTFFLCPSQAQVAWSRGSTHDVASAFKREKIVNHFSERRRVRIPRVYYSCFLLPFTTKRDQTCRTTWKVRQWNMLQAWQCKTKDKRWDKEHPHTNTTQTNCGKTLRKWPHSQNYQCPSEAPKAGDPLEPVLCQAGTVKPCSDAKWRVKEPLEKIQIVRACRSIQCVLVRCPCECT